MTQHQEISFTPPVTLLPKLFDSLTVLVCVLDKSGRFLYVNRTAHAILGYEPEELIGKSCFDLMLEEDRPYSNSAFEDSLATDQVAAVENRYYHKDGRIVHLVWEGGGYDKETGNMYSSAKDVTEQRRLEVIAKEYQSEQELLQKRITAAVVQATEQERALVGQELHDNVNQVLTTVKLYTELSLSDTVNKQELLTRSAQLIQHCINEIRGLSKRLSAPSLGDILLRDSVQELVDAINASSRFAVQYEQSINELPVPGDMHIAVYRILQEHFTNIIKHAAASQVNVQLYKEDHLLHVVVDDNGKGFDTREAHKGIGIENMTNRAESFGGSLELGSAPGKGCTLHLVMPIESTDLLMN
jgi:PAS domain S-box-containing protein